MTLFCQNSQKNHLQVWEHDVIIISNADGYPQPMKLFYYPMKHIILSRRNFQWQEK